MEICERNNRHKTDHYSPRVQKGHHCFPLLAASSLGYLPFLELGENATFLPGVDDGASDSIDIPLGFPLSDGSVQDRVYVSTYTTCFKLQ